jgi:hypothetical protein
VLDVRYKKHNYQGQKLTVPIRVPVSGHSKVINRIPYRYVSILGPACYLKVKRNKDDKASEGHQQHDISSSEACERRKNNFKASVIKEWNRLP